MTRLVLALAFLGALAAPARAGSDVGVVVAGDGSTQLTAQIETWLTQHGRVVVPTPLPPEAVSALIDCLAMDNRPCASDVVEKRAKSSSVLYTRIDSKSGSRDITLTAYWLAKGAGVAFATRACARCTDEALRTTADALMKKLVGGETGHIKLTSNPPGATISIDGVAIGVTPLDWDIIPGKHTIRMEKPGLRPATRDVTVTAGKLEAVGMVMLPPGADDANEATDGGPARSSRIVPIAVLAAGGALLVAGGVMIAIDEDKGPKSPPTIRNTAPAGVGLAIGGVVVGAVGTYLMWFRSPSSSAPVAAVSRDGAYVGWAGRF